MSKYDKVLKKLKCRKCEETVQVDHMTTAVVCWKCTMLETGGSGIISDEPAHVNEPTEESAPISENETD